MYITYGLILLVGCSSANLVGTDQPRADLHEHSQKKKVIHWGGDIDESLIENIYYMQRMPFDGTVLYVPDKVERKIFSALPIPKEKVDRLITILKQTNFTRFTDNFLLIRMFFATGRLPTPPLSWYDDDAWETVAWNFGQMARLAKEGGLKGFFLDNEHYPDWHLTPGSRDGNIAQKRGAGVMQTIRRYFPDVIVIASHGYANQAEAAAHGWGGVKPFTGPAEPENEPQDPATGLPVVWPGFYNVSSGFLDGLLIASDPRYRFVEGLGVNQAYGAVKKEQFEHWYRLAHDWDYWKQEKDPTSAFSATRVPKLLREQGRVSFGHYHNVHGPNGTTVEALSNGLAVADEYIWVYSDSPYGFVEPTPLSAPVAQEIATMRGPDYAIELPAPQPVLATIARSVEMPDGTTRHTVMVSSFKGSITHFKGTLTVDFELRRKSYLLSPVRERPIDLDLNTAPVTKILDVFAPKGRSFTLEGEVTNSVGKRFAVKVSLKK